MDEIDEPIATITERRFYWRTSAVILWIGALLIVKVIYEFYKPKSPLRKKMFIPFRLLVFGDFVYVICVYLPYHTYNAIASAGNDDYSLSNPIVCKLWVFLVAIAVTINMLAATCIWVFMYYLVKELNPIDAHKSSLESTRFMRKWCIISFVVGFAWGTFAMASDSYSEFRGLYCGLRFGGDAYGNVNCLLAISMINMSTLCMFYYFYHSLQLLHQEMSEMSGGTSDRVMEKKIAKSLVNVGFQTTAIYFTCWTPIGLYIMLRLFGVELPIEYAIVCNLLVKIQPSLNCIFILRCPAYRNGKKKQHLQEATSTKLAKSKGATSRKVAPVSTRANSTAIISGQSDS